MSNAIDNILKDLAPIIDKMEAAIVSAIENDKKTPRKVGNWSRQMIRLGIIYDMVRSLEKYIKPTDSYKILNTRGSIKGNLEIGLQINRDGQQYYLDTQAIYAGGHNIQVLHYRYITKTNVPETGNTEMSKKVKDKIKRLSKGDKYRSEIDRLENLITTLNADINKSRKLSDKQILDTHIRPDKLYKHLFTKWEDISDAAPIKSHPDFKQTKEEYEAEQLQNIKNAINNWKYRNIEVQVKRVDTTLQDIKKLQSKLDALSI